MLSQNSLITNFPQNIFLCVQNKRIHTGLDLLSVIFIFVCTVPLKFKQRQVCIMLLYIIISHTQRMTAFIFYLNGNYFSFVVITCSTFIPLEECVLKKAQINRQII